MFLNERDTAALYRVRRYIVENSHSPIRIDELMQLSGMKETKLRQGFRQLFNDSLYHYYLKYAMQYAKTQLDNGAQVKQVAYTLGYSNSSNFCRAYKKIHHTSPARRLR